MNLAVRIKVGPLVAFIDDKDEPLVRQFTWYPVERSATSTHAQAWDGRRKGRILMHRLILGLLDEKTARIKHKNGNGLDNQRGNLIIRDSLSGITPRRASETIFDLYGPLGPRVYCPKKFNEMIAPARCQEYQKARACSCANAVSEEIVSLIQIASKVDDEERE